MEVMKISSPGKFDETVVDRNDARERMNEQQRKKMQHEFKIYMEQYF